MAILNRKLNLSKRSLVIVKKILEDEMRICYLENCTSYHFLDSRRKEKQEKKLHDKSRYIYSAGSRD